MQLGKWGSSQKAVYPPDARLFLRNMEPVLEYKDTLGGISDVDLSSHIIKGYASVFGNIDSDGDIMVKGAYAKTISEWGPQGKGRIKMCWQHDIYDPIAKTIELFEDDRGLGFVAAAPKNVSHIDDRIKMIEGGVIDELSVGFRTIKQEAGQGVRRITEVKLYEYSLVTLASNELAKVTMVKGEQREDFIKRLQIKSQNIVKMMRNGTLTDESFHDLEFYHLQLLKHISDLMKPSTDTSAEPEKSTQQDDRSDSEVIKSLQDLKLSLRWN